MVATEQPRKGRLLRRVWPYLALGGGALALRLVGLDWDQGQLFHPDERRIAEAVAGMSFHPLQLDPRFFAYGTLPLYLIRLVCSLLSVVSPFFDSSTGIVLTGRVLSALWGTATVLLLASLGRRLHGERVGLLAGGLLGIAVAHVQNSHFATVDVPLTCLVVLALSLAVRLLDDVSTGRIVAAGLAVGLALATKASAAPLVLPLVLAVSLGHWPGRRWGKAVAATAMAGAATMLGFVLGEPYAVLAPGRLFAALSEQGAMVRHAGGVPYTTQYVGATPLVYDIGQLVVWGLGLPLGLAALAGAAGALRRARGGARPEWLLLAFAVPFLLLTVSFEVKFPRYLLPLYPLLALWAATGLTTLADRGRLGRVVRASVLAGSGLYLLAFMSIYLRPHTVVAASRWLYEEVPAGSRVLSQHWDEGFPVALPGHSGGDYDVTFFPYYDPDTREKVTQLSQELAASDYVAFQTRRLYGAIPRDPGRYPYTSNYFYLLLGGDLGFEPVFEAVSRPRLLGLELPDELADESFSVYDHPKVLILANRAHLDATAIAGRIRSNLPSRPWTLDDLLRVGPGRAPVGRPPVPVGSGNLASLLGLAALIELLGLAAYTVVRVWVGPRPGLYGLARVLGPLAVALVTWELVAWGWLPFERATVLGVALALVVTAGLALRRDRTSLPPRREWLVTTAVFWGAALFFLALRAANPEVFWGEKPMDFSFLNMLYRTTTLPPPEPWAAGTTLSYTYFGHFLVAGFGKALTIPPGVMFNLGIALVAGLLGAALLAAGTALGGRLRVGLAAVFLGMIVGNLAGPWALWKHRALSFDYFWSTSRVIPDTINEFPFWSLTFADLHAHVLAMPFAVAVLAGAVLLATGPVDSRRRAGTVALTILTATAFAALVLGNGWGVPSWGAVVAVVLLTGWWRSARLGPRSAALTSLVREVAAPGLGIVGIAVVLALPFWLHYAPPPLQLGIETGPGARPWQAFLVFGHFLVLLGPFLALTWWRSLGTLSPREGRWRAVAASVLLVLLISSLVSLRGLAEGVPRWAGSIAAFSLVLALLGVWAAVTAAADHEALCAALAALAFGIIGGCELLFVWDRMNTVFKLHLDAWLLLAVGGAPVLVDLLNRGRAGRARVLWQLVVGAALAVAVLTAGSGALAAVTNRHVVVGPRGTLDGSAYLGEQDGEEAAAFGWINRHVPGTPTVVEAAGPSYQSFARVAMHTGLPTVLGWDYHLYQRGLSRDEIDARESAVATIYTSPSAERVASELAAHRVALVFVGKLEKSTYGDGCLTRFGEWSGFLRPVYETAEVSIFAVSDVVAGAPLDLSAAAVVATDSGPVSLP